MTLIKKLKSTEFVITLSFYSALLIIPFFVQKGYADFSLYSAFFFNRNLNIMICIVPAVLGVFFRKKIFDNKALTLAITDTLILFLVFIEFFVSANYYLNLLTAIFILLFILINTNEMFAVAGIIPFFFLTELDIFHYVLLVAIPLILLLFIKLQQTENKTKKTILRITLFIQCYICVFFAALLISEAYSPYINITAPQFITIEYTIKTVITIVLLILVTVFFVINVFRNSQKAKEKAAFTLPAIILFFFGIAGYFTDVFSTVNRTAVLLNLIYIIIFNTQYSLIYPTQQKHKTITSNIITISLLTLFCLSMIF